MGELWKVIEMLFRVLTHVSPRCIRGGSDPPREGALLRGACAGPLLCIFPSSHDYIAHCSSAAAGKCAFPAHAADTCVGHRQE